MFIKIFALHKGQLVSIRFFCTHSKRPSKENSCLQFSWTLTLMILSWLIGQNRSSLPSVRNKSGNPGIPSSIANPALSINLFAFRIVMIKASGDRMAIGLTTENRRLCTNSIARPSIDGYDSVQHSIVFGGL